MTNINDKKIPFRQIRDALLNPDAPVNPLYLYRLSDLEPSELDQLKKAWPGVPLWRKQALLEDIEELSNKDMLLDFVEFSRFAIQDEDPRVRMLAVRTLWDYEDKDLIPLLLQLLGKDRDGEVRAAAAGALGKYVYAGEVEELSPVTQKRVEEALLAACQRDADPEVRRDALEALGYSSRPEVSRLIETAFKSPDKNWVASALFAMGRSANEEWQPQVMSMLENQLPLLRTEAARAAGELEMADAVPILLEMLDDPDLGARAASIWALSQLGGEGVREALQALFDQSEDEQETELLEEALENLSFIEGARLMPMFGFPEDAEADGEEGDLDDDDDSLDEYGLDEDEEDYAEIDEFSDEDEEEPY
jgi:HEAT repeat protein